MQVQEISTALEEIAQIYLLLFASVCDVFVIFLLSSLVTKFSCDIKFRASCLSSNPSSLSFPAHSNNQDFISNLNFDPCSSFIAMIPIAYFLSHHDMNHVLKVGAGYICPFPE